MPTHHDPTKTLRPLELVALVHVAHGTHQTDAAQAMGTSPRTYRRLLTQATKKLQANTPVHAACLAVSKGLLISHGPGFRPAPTRRLENR